MKTRAKTEVAPSLLTRNTYSPRIRRRHKDTEVSHARWVNSCAQRILIVIAAAFCCGTLTAENPRENIRNVQFSELTARHGLSSEFVHDVAQDGRGYMWFATQSGLNRYDGREIRTYEHQYAVPGSLSANWVWTLFVDADGTLWAGTEAGTDAQEFGFTLGYSLGQVDLGTDRREHGLAHEVAVDGIGLGSGEPVVAVGSVVGALVVADEVDHVERPVVARVDAQERLDGSDVDLLVTFGASGSIRRL